MRILDLVPPEAIVGDLRSGTKEGVIRELSAAIARAAPPLREDTLAAVLLEREDLGSTGIGGGAAIPHGKVPGIDRLVAAFGRSREGVPFQALDGKPAHLFFAIVAPEQSAGMHLKALARISRLLRDEGFRRSLFEAVDAGDIRRIFRELDEQP